MAIEVLTYDELDIPSVVPTSTYDELTVTGITPTLTYTDLTLPTLFPALEWDTVQAQQLFPALEWEGFGEVKFNPNLVNYPFHFMSPYIVSSICPVAFSGCLAGFTIYMKNTGSSGQTKVEIYASGILRHTETIPANNQPFNLVEHLDRDFLMRPLHELEIRVIEVADDAEDLKINLYQMTFPFELESAFHGNLIDDIHFSGIDKNYLFYSADYWFVEFNQPVKQVDSITMIDTNGDATDLDSEDITIETGFFFNNRVKFLPFTTAPVDHIRLRVRDYENKQFVVNIYPIVSPLFANWPEFFSERVISSELGVTDLTTGKNATATTGIAGDAIDDVVGDNPGEYWVSVGGLPVHWAVDLGLGNGRIARKLRVKPFSDDDGVAMKDFDIWGSNLASPNISDDNDWEYITTDMVASNEDWQEFEFSNDTEYRHYRLTIANTYRTDSTVGIIELELFEGIDVESPVLDVDLYLAATRYRVSFNNGVSFGEWITVPASQRITLDFTGLVTDTYQVKIDYEIGTNILTDSFEILYAQGTLAAEIKFLGEFARVKYSDDIPFNRIEIFYNEDFVLADSPTIINPVDITVVTDNSLKQITIDPVSVYYQNQKYDFSGSPYIVQPDFTNNATNFKVLFGFNTESKIFEFREFENTNPGVLVPGLNNFITLYMKEYIVTFDDINFLTYEVFFNSGAVNNAAVTEIPLDLSQGKSISIYVYDIAGRFIKATLPYNKTKFNIWRNLTVQAQPMSSSYQANGTYLSAIDDSSSTFWETPSDGSLPQWLRYDFGNGNPKTAVEYTISIVNSDASSKPTGWILQGSNDGITWTDLDTVVGETWANDGPKVYSIDTPEAFTSYRLYVTNSSGGSYVKIREWQLREVVSGSDILDPEFTIEILPGEIHGFNALDYLIDSENWQEPL